MTTTLRATTAALMAGVCALATVIDATAAAAQSGPPPAPAPGQYYGSGGYRGGEPAGGPSPSQYPPPPSQSPGNAYPPAPGEYAPPAGQYAPPPPGAETPGSVYDAQAQRYDYEYARRYSDWAARYCIERRNDNTAAGAIIGGVLGAVIGGGLSGRYDRGAGILAGGALGAAAGGLIGASSTAPGGCPSGYVVRGGAPAFVYEGPAADVFWAPAGYNPWVFVGGAWVYHPYRYWYFSHGAYWRPGWRPGGFVYQYRRW